MRGGVLGTGRGWDGPGLGRAGAGTGRGWGGRQLTSISAVELLRTPRLVLRDWQEADLAAYFDLYSRWEVVRWPGSHPRPALTAQ